MKNLSYERRTTGKQKIQGILMDTLKVGLPYAGMVFLLGWVISEIF